MTHMNRHTYQTRLGIGLLLSLTPLVGHAFNSGSTGADGAFNPQVNTELQLPPDGVFNFTSVNIPNGVTVTFKRNATNTPAVILAQGDIVIEGTIDVSAKPPAPLGGDLSDDGLPGVGGPGGFDGGHGTIKGVTDAAAGDGLGPGAGGGGAYRQRGGCAGHATAAVCGTRPGGAYGSSLLRPLIGGSGGGGHGGSEFGETTTGGGGGGGGAILIATSGKIRVNGTVRANASFAGGSYAGGPGSGGAIRLVADDIAGSGQLRAEAPSNDKGFGRIRVEAEQFGGLTSSPALTLGQPTDLFVPGLPGLAITSVAGIAVPANPVGRSDVALAAATPNPAEVMLRTKGVPPGTVVKVTMTPEFGAKTTVDSPPTAGSLDDATASVSLDIPDGRSVLMATTTFTVTAALGEQLAPFAQGERVERVRLTTSPGQPSTMVLLTASGHEVEAPAAALAAGW